MAARMLAWVAACALAAGAADVVITSEQKAAETISIGFTDFVCTKGDPASLQFQPGTVVAWDLEFSGRFKLTQSSKFDSASKLIMAQDGALAYARGEYALEGGAYTLLCELIDLETGEKILGKTYTGKLNDLRQAAHKFSDEMVYQLFGERGIAQSRIAYASKRAGNKEIFVMDYDGANVREITANASINLAPCWLEGKAKVLYTSYTSGRPQFHIKDFADGSNQAFGGNQAMNTAGSYNRMDKEIVYASVGDGNSEIYRRAYPDGKPVRLTFSGSIEVSPSWSPNGYEIVFVSDRSGNPMLYVMDRDGSNIRRITYEGSYHGSPSWSPRGDRIVFSSIDDGNNMNIFTISPDGKDQVKLTTASGSNENPSWSPDARHIVFMSTRTGSSEIFMMAQDGANQKRISFSGGNSMPRWSDY